MKTYTVEEIKKIFEGNEKNLEFKAIKINSMLVVYDDYEVSYNNKILKLKYQKEMICSIYIEDIKTIRRIY